MKTPMTLGHRMPTAFLRQVDIWPQTWKPKLTVSSQRIWWMLKFCFMLELSSLYTMLTCSAAATSRQLSPTVRPYRRQPIRLLCPWDSPGKNTGVGCHFLLQCMKVKSESEVAQLCPPSVTPWTAAFQAPPSTGFSRQEHWSGLPLPSPWYS